MNGCGQVQEEFTEYLDGRLTGREMQEIDAHLEQCRACAAEWKSLRDLRGALAGLGPAPEPAGLPLRIRVAVSRERARSRRSVFTAWELAWKNTLGPFLLHAAAGFLSAVLLLGTATVLVSVFAQPDTAQATPTPPVGSATAPHLLYYSNAPGNGDINVLSSPVVVEAYVNGEGEVYDFRIISGPTDATTRSAVENLLLFSRFEPARLLGQPVRGLAVLSFSGVSVRG